MPKEKKNNFLVKKIEKRTNQHNLNLFQATIGLQFKKISLLKTALTHTSYVNESNLAKIHNERLEYLGDSILAFIINEYLYKKFKPYSEGELAKIKSVVVSEPILNKIAKKIQLGQFLFLGYGEEQSGGRERSSILADTLEALIGAIYLDSGLKKCRDFILSCFKDEINRIDKSTYHQDPKTALQEYVQKKFKNQPDYILVEETGPDHQKKFSVELVINKQKILRAQGSSKRKAEMKAAKLFWNKIKGEKI